MKAPLSVAALAVAVVLAGPALGADDPRCPGADLFEVQGWRSALADAIPGVPIRRDARPGLRVDLVYRGDRPLVMLQGDVKLLDAFGRYLTSAYFDPDLHAAPGEAVVAHATTGVDDRVVTIDPALVVVEACVSAIAYADGTIWSAAEEVAAKEAERIAEREAARLEAAREAARNEWIAQSKAAEEARARAIALGALTEAEAEAE